MRDAQVNELVVQIVSPDQFKELYEKCKNSDQKKVPRSMSCSI